MNTIGQRLREARERKGVSLRDASEEIKVRSDYLGHFEEDCFDFGLPEIYRRGFLELYGQYLKLDMKSLIDDYLALSAQGKKKTKREVYAHVELPAKDEKVSLQDSEDESEQQPVGSRKRWIFAGGGICAAAVIGGVLMWLSSEDAGFSEKSTPPVALASQASVASASSNAAEDIELVAQGDVHVIVRQELDKQKLLKRKLVAGDRVTFKKRGPIKIHFSEGGNLQIIRDGRAYGMGARGVGVTELG